MSADAFVRDADEDRWFASRFAPKAARERLVALYALNHEIARVSETVTQAPIGEIKLAWWREALGELAQGKPARAHPALAAFAVAVAGVSISWDALEGIVHARGADLDGEPFATWDEVESYIDATAGEVARVGVSMCGASASETLVRSVGRAWGYAGLARAHEAWRARGRSALPREGGTKGEMLARAEAAYAAVRVENLESAAFPALGYVALVPTYVRAVRHERSEVSPFERQLKLVAAAAFGRL